MSRTRRQLEALTEEIKRAENAGKPALVDQLLRQKQQLVNAIRNEQRATEREEIHGHSN